MKNLAIRGSLIRCDEVIKILESLGGTNKKNLCGTKNRYFYFIDSNGIIDKIFEEDMLISQWETHTIDSYKSKYKEPNPNFIYKKKDIGKELNTEFNEVYDAITIAYEKICDFHIKHCAFIVNVDKEEILDEIRNLFERLGDCRTTAHEIAEYFTWDN